MNIQKPFNDENLQYDYDLHQYRLTLSYAKSKVGNSYQDDKIMENRLDDISNTIYDHIYSNSNTHNFKQTQVILACSIEGRNLIKEALTRQLKADADNGYNDINKQNPINFQSGGVIDRNEIRKNEISISAENILLNSSAFLDGYNIMCQAVIILPTAFLTQFNGLEF